MKGDPDVRSGITRRSALLGAAAFGAGVAADRILGSGSSDDLSGGHKAGAATVAFRGPRQAGIATPPPDFMSFAAFDLTSRAVDDLRMLLQEWTTAAAVLTSGQQYQGPDSSPSRVPSDPGEATGLRSVRIRRRPPVGDDDG